LTLTAYYSSQSIKTKTAYHGVKLKWKAIFLNIKMCLYTHGTPYVRSYGCGANMEWITDFTYKENLCLIVCNVLAVRVTHLMTSTFLWDVTPCHQHSVGACCLSAFVVQEDQPYPKNGYILFHYAIYAWR
jgi:hypothetical protein